MGAPGYIFNWIALRKEEGLLTNVGQISTQDEKDQAYAFFMKCFGPLVEMVAGNQNIVIGINARSILTELALTFNQNCLGSPVNAFNISHLCRKAEDWNLIPTQSLPIDGVSLSSDWLTEHMTGKVFKRNPKGCTTTENRGVLWDIGFNLSKPQLAYVIKEMNVVLRLIVNLRVTFKFMEQETSETLSQWNIMETMCHDSNCT